MNLLQAEKAVEAEKKERDNLRREQRQASRDLLKHVLDNLGGSGLQVANQKETDESWETSLLVVGSMPPQYVMLIAHDIGSLVLQRRDQYGAVLRSETATNIEDAMKATVRLSQG